MPAVERPVDEPPPFTVVVHGPPGVGKSTLIKCLIKHFTRQDIRDVKGPVTVISGKTRRLTFVECPPDLFGMIDAAKYADLVLLVIDGAFGFEMETFEFLNLLQVHGFPKVMGVLTHLDGFRDNKALKKTKKILKHRFWAEIYQGAKLFYLSGIKNGRYLKREVHNLARFISVMKFRPLSWRQAHPYLLADRFEDVTSVERIRTHPRCDRDIILYGYVRGTNWKNGTKAHIAGVGDYDIEDIAMLPDPCPLPSQLKKRSLNDRERLVYAPMSDVGGLLFDRDAMYVDIPEWKMQYSKPTVGGAEDGVGEAMVRDLQRTNIGVDEKLDQAQIQLFANGEGILGADLDFLSHNPDVLHGEGVEDESDESEEEVQEDTDESDDSDDDDDNYYDDNNNDDDRIPSEQFKLREKPIEQQLVSPGGRTRRRALFPADSVAEKDKITFDDEDSDEDYEVSPKSSNHGNGITNGADNDDDKYEEEGLGAAARWKARMLERASTLFSDRAADLQEIIYGNSSNDISEKLADSLDSEEDEDFLRPVRRDGRSRNLPVKDGREEEENMLDVDVDSSRNKFSADSINRWCEEGATEALRDRFVTGDWSEGAARADARPMEDSDGDGDGDDEDDVFGEFEDVETGKHFAGDTIEEADDAVVKDIAAKKAAKKAAFDVEYDESGGGKGIRDALIPKKKGINKDEESEEETFYDAMKREMAERAERTKAAMDTLDPVQRVAMEVRTPRRLSQAAFQNIIICQYAYVIAGPSTRIICSNEVCWHSI